MDFTTKVQIPPIKEGITYKNKILMLGSCFANEVGNWLKDYRFHVKVNPFGTLYNPCSIANSVERLATAREFTPEEVIESNGIFTSFCHHSSIYAPSKEEFLQTANKQLRENAAFFKEADTFIITLGTAYIYRHIAKNITVSNCHKIKAAAFERRLMTIEECLAALNRIVTAIVSLSPDTPKKIIFTISPIRHLKDGAHGNQISKATLLMAVEQMIQSPQEILHPQKGVQYRNFSYFPAYEIMMDELRDYRFYACDMLHPSPLAVEYIFERFKGSFISPMALTVMQEAIRLTKSQNHRPLFPGSEEHAKFQKKLEQDLERFNQHYQN